MCGWRAACADGGWAEGGPCCCARAHPCQPLLRVVPSVPLPAARCYRPVAAWTQPGEHLLAAELENTWRGCLLWRKERAWMHCLRSVSPACSPTPPRLARPPRPAGFPPHLMCRCGAQHNQGPPCHCPRLHNGTCCGQRAAASSRRSPHELRATRRCFKQALAARAAGTAADAGTCATSLFRMPLHLSRPLHITCILEC